MKAGIDRTFLGEFTNDAEIIIFRVFATKIVFRDKIIHSSMILIPSVVNLLMKNTKISLMAGFRPDSEIIGNFLKIGNFMVILLSVTNDAYSRILSA